MRNFFSKHSFFFKTSVKIIPVNQSASTQIKMVGSIKEGIYQTSDEKHMNHVVFKETRDMRKKLLFCSIRHCPMIQIREK